MRNDRTSGGSKGLGFKQILLFFIVLEMLVILTGAFRTSLVLSILIPVSIYFMYLTISGRKIIPGKYWYLFIPFLFFILFTVYSVLFNGLEEVSEKWNIPAEIFFAIFLLSLIPTISFNIRKNQPRDNYVANFSLSTQTILLYLAYAVVLLIGVFFGEALKIHSSTTTIMIYWKDVLNIFVAISIILKVVFLIKKKKEAMITENTVLTSEEIKGCKQKLKLLFEERKIYRRHDLDKEMIARRTGFSVAELDYFWIKHLGKDYLTFVSEYRIAHSLELMKQNGKCSKCLNHISYESGFTSRTVFARFFYEMTDQYPSEYEPNVSFALIETMSDKNVYSCLN